MKTALLRPAPFGQAYVVRAYSMLAFFSLGIFGGLHVAQGALKTVGYLELGGAVLFLGNILLVQFTRHVRLAQNIFLLTVLVFLLVMLTTGGTQNTGVFWFFVFPVAAFFLTGKRQGLLWMATFLTTMVVVWILAADNTITIPYDSVTIRQLLISVLVVAAGIYAYQWSREQLQDATTESRNELRTERVRADVIVQNIGEGIVVTDADANVTFMNHTAETLLGWTLEQAAGKNFIDLVPMLDEAGRLIEATGRPLRRALQESEAVTARATYRRKDGKPVPVSITNTPIIVGGTLVGGIGTFRDISEEQGVARAKSEFVTLASHQLRTPISAIAWMTELLLSGDAGQLTDEQQKHLQGIYQSNRRMADLVGEMLMVSSLDLGSLPVTPQKLNLSRLAARIVKEQRDAYPDKKQRITEDYQADLPPLQADPDIVRILLRNIISNAIKYTPADGSIAVTLAVDASQRTKSDSAGSIIITVQDTGYGIPESVANKIFNKFFRAENVLHKDTDGTGLGLYIVKALLDYVGGRISFSSEEGKGTTFTLLLPLEGMQPHQQSEQQGERKHA